MAITFEYDGMATLAGLSAKREGGAKDRLLAAELSLVIETDSDILLSFHPQLRLMMFDREGEPRFPKMGKVNWKQEFADQVLRFYPADRDELRFVAKLKGFVFFCKKGGRVILGMLAQVKPSDGEFERLGQMLVAQSVKVKTHPEIGDLFLDALAKHKRGEQMSSPESEGNPEAPSVLPEDLPASLDLDDQEDEAAAIEPGGEPQPLAAAELPLDHDSVVPAFNRDGRPLGFPLDKRQFPVGTFFEREGVTYDIVGQAWNRIVLEARAAAAVPLEISEGLLAFMRTAGAAEAKKEEDERDFEIGFATACGNAKLPKALVEEHLAELQKAFTDGYEQELNEAESR